MRTFDWQPKYYVASLTTQAGRNLVQYYNRVLAPLGLTAQQAISLGVLWSGGEMSLGEFAHRAGMGKAAAVAMITRLETMGLVHREANPDDRRLNVISLTRKADELAPEVAEKVEELERTVEKALGKEKLKAVLEGLAVIRDLDL